MSLERLLQLTDSHKAQRIWLHVLFWILLSCVQWYLVNISFNPYQSFSTGLRILRQVSATINIILFYYPFVYWILPAFRQPGRRLVSIFLIVFLLAVYSLLDAVMEGFFLSRCVECMRALKDTNKGYFDFLHLSLANRTLVKLISMGTLISLLFSIALPLSIKLGLQTLRQQFQFMQLSKENLQLEFDFLRSQVNPHFLFNSLNNIYGLILKDEKNKSADLVARLSHFLRYTLYESGSKVVAIEKEVQLLKDYVDLESIRLNHTKVNFTYTTDGSVRNIPPLLTVPVFENAFKYCSDNAEAFIEIFLRVKESAIFFQSKNTIDQDRQSLQKGGGIGINNLRKRLQLYYPGVHKFDATAFETEYVLTISIFSHDGDQMHDCR